MFFKQNLCMAFILLVVVILFSFFSEYRYQEKIGVYEGLSGENNTANVNEDVSFQQEMSDMVPACYNTVLDDKTMYDYNKDKYILKTEIVPPVCPACPSVFSQHNHNVNTSNLGDASDNVVDVSENNFNLPDVTNVNISNEIFDIPNNINTNEQQSVQNNLLTPPRISNNPNQYQNNYLNSQQNALSNQQNALSNQQNALSNQQNTLNNQENNYELQIQDLKNEINRLKQQNQSSNKNECPPCPPCDRCPEPIFSCEKTINYRSPNVGQYLPLPVLNDFSSFDNTR